MDINHDSLQDLSQQMTRTARTRIVHLLLFFVLPIIPSISVFVGVYIVGWPSSKFIINNLSFENALNLSLFVYFSFLSIIAIMASFVYFLTKHNGDCRNYLSSLNYLTYLSLPFVFFGLFLVKPSFVMLATGFISATLYSAFMFYRSFHNFLGLGCIHDTNKFASLFSTAFIFLVVSGLHVLFFINQFPEIYYFLTNSI
jgi:hypothetical protein